MKRVLIAVLVLFISLPAFAHVELGKETDHPVGWVYQFHTMINGTSYPIEVPFNKCKKTDAKKECYATKREATNAAWAKAKKLEKLMRAALEKKQ